MTSTPQYLLISPCRNEAEYLERTIESVLRQSMPPAVWVIVDDGSSDETPALLARYAAQNSFIRIVRREDRGARSVGPGVIDAFYAGYRTVDPTEFDYLCKLDLDLELPERYFEELIRRMVAEPRIGTCSGKPYVPTARNTLEREKCGDEMSVGMTKFYRRECFEQIGGFVREVMWDGIDCHRCRELGWIACSWNDPMLRFTHLRPMGSSQYGVLTGRMRHGYGQYFMGTSLAYMTVSALYRATCRPILIGSVAMWWGYIRARLARRFRYGDHEFRRFLNRYQWSCLLRGKKRATALLDARQEAVWNRQHRSTALSGHRESATPIHATTAFVTAAH